MGDLRYALSDLSWLIKMQAMLAVLTEGANALKLVRVKRRFGVHLLSRR